MQPNAQAIAVNRIGGNAPSQILGTLDANGHIVLINGNGMLFGKGSQVNVGSLVATSTGGSDSDVLAVKFTQRGNQNASVVNQGRITTSQGGLVALVAPSVTNAGTVNAKFGTVALGAANKFTVDFTGDGLVSFAAQGDVNGRAVATNTGSLVGANVSLTAHAANGVATGVVNMNGIIQAQGVRNVGGTILLDAGNGGNVSVSNAKLDASGANGGGSIQIGSWNENAAAVDKASVLNASATRTGNGGSISVISGDTSFQGSALARGGISGGNGGTIETSGHNLNFTGASVDAGATQGRDGSWLLDPYDLTVNSAAASTIDSSLASNTNVTLQTTASGTSGPGNPNPSGNGDIIIDSPIAWSTAATFSLSAYRNIDINADVTISGGGALHLTSGTGSSGDYVISSADNISFTGASSSGAKLLIDNKAYTLIYTMSGLQGINATNTTLMANYALAVPLNAAGTTNWVPIGTDGGGNIRGCGFCGTFAGLGNTISNLTFSSSFIDYVGLFGYLQGTIRDLGLTGGSITGGDMYIGALVGYSDGGTILDDYTTTTLSGGFGDVGGLVGYNKGTITKARAGGSVSGLDTDIGGLVGLAQHNSTIIDAHATGAAGSNSSSDVVGLVGLAQGGTISTAYATGDVVGAGDVGGLVGQNVNQSIIDIAYATGTVTGSSVAIGGLVGSNAKNGTIIDAYATGAVSGGNGARDIGGLVGSSGTNDVIMDAYSAGAVSAGSGSSNIGGLVGASSDATISNGYWDTQTSGQSTSAGGNGNTTAQLQSGLPTGFDPAIWGQSASINGGLPYLLGLPPSRIIDGRDWNDNCHLCILSIPFRLGLHRPRILRPAPVGGKWNAVRISRGGGGGRRCADGCRGAVPGRVAGAGFRGRAEQRLHKSQLQPERPQSDQADL